MNRTKIEWVKNPDGTQGYTWNPLSGCLNHTPEGLCLGGLFPCYAWKLAHRRLKPLYLANLNLAGIECKDHYAELEVEPEQMYDPFYPRFWEDRIVKADRILKATKKPMGIFPVDMGDWCGIGIPESWSDWILELARRYSQHRFYLLTKQPQNLIKFSPFPENCWVGVTVTKQSYLTTALYYLSQTKAAIRYLSIEPMLEDIHLFLEYNQLCIKETIDWLIIGACTGTMSEMARLASTYSQPFRAPWDRVKPLTKTLWTLQPKIEWVCEIVEAADKAGVKVFLKDNLRPLLRGHPIPKKDMWAYRFEQGVLNLRQELPIEQ